MPSYLKHFPEYNLDIAVGSGVLTVDEMLKAFESFDEKTNWIGVLTKESDLSGIDVTLLPKLKQAVTPGAPEGAGAEPKKSALLSLGEAGQFFFRFWANYAAMGVRRPRQRKIFTKLDEACQWLELPPDAVEKLAAAIAAAEAESVAGPTPRSRLLKSASRIFGKGGFEAMTVAEALAAAHLPREALEDLSDSKDDLIVHALLDAMGDVAPIEGDLARFAAAYLAPARKADVAGRYAMAALAADVLRESPSARAALTAGLTWHIDRLSRIAPGEDAAGRRRAAVRAWSAMIGALILARVSDDEALSQEFLDDARSWLADPAVAAAKAAGPSTPDIRSPS